MADSHESCTCHNGDSYNWRITSPACDFYVTDRPAVRIFLPLTSFFPSVLGCPPGFG